MHRRLQLCSLILCALGCLSEPPPFIEPTSSPDGSMTPQSDATLVGNRDMAIDILDASRTCAPVEACNGLDDDCDGKIDESAISVGSVCISDDEGACQTMGRQVCIDGTLTCEAASASPSPETCNGIDDDCDGLVDNVVGADEPCDATVGVCSSAGTKQCDIDTGQLVCRPIRAIEPTAEEELCNGVDDDCDSLIDEGRACGDFIAQNCQFALAFNDLEESPTGNYLSLGLCPEQNGGYANVTTCAITQYRNQMQAIEFGLNWGIDENDSIGALFRCRSDGLSDVHQWIQSACRIDIGVSTARPDQARPLTWADCPDVEISAGGPTEACVSTPADGSFNTVSLRAILDRPLSPDSSLGISFRCDAPDGERAATVESSVNVVLALADESAQGTISNVRSWPSCSDGPDPPPVGRVWCAETKGRPGFAILPVERTLAFGYLGHLRRQRFKFGISLKPVSLMSQP